MVSQLDDTTRRDGPVRTCIGCRGRATKRELLRLVAGTDAEDPSRGWSVVPDPRGTAPGRGAHLHPTTECLALAERKRAFVRALRHDAQARGALSLEPLRAHLAQREAPQDAAPREAAPRPAPPADAPPTETAPFQNGSTSS